MQNNLEVMTHSKKTKVKKTQSKQPVNHAIRVKGARENNLKNITLEIPKDTLTVVTGLSGSGKSSLAFDTVYAEGQRRYIESLSTYARAFLDSYSKPDVDAIDGLCPSIAIDQKTVGLSPRSTVGTITEIYDFLRLLFSKAGVPKCPSHKIPVQGQTVGQIVEEIYSLPKNTKYYIFAPIARSKKGEFQKEFQKWIKLGFVSVRIDGKFVDLTEDLKLKKTIRHNIDIVVDKLVSNGKDSLKLRISDSVSKALSLTSGTVSTMTLKGTEKNYSINRACPECGFSFPELDPLLFSFNSPLGACEACQGLGTGEIEEFEEEHYSAEQNRRYTKNRWRLKKKTKGDDDEDLSLRKLLPCKSCDGNRLKEESRNVFINNKTISELSNLSLDDLLSFITKYKPKGPTLAIYDPIKKELLDRLGYLLKVGAGYLSLDRRSNTLSGGEAQRIRLASQIGAALVGVLYVLDEPSIGLHPRDHNRLLDVLKTIRDRGNTVVVVEHDADTIKAADHIIDIGPGAGVNGGELIFSGSLAKLKKCDSLTGKYISEKIRVDYPKTRREGSGSFISIHGASGNNLKNVSVKIPLSTLTIVTGVSGSGKSTLVIDTLYKHLSNSLYSKKFTPDPFKKIEGHGDIDRIIQIDQKAIGRTPRSCPATYTGLFPMIRDLFALLPDSKIRGYKPGQFSFNVKAGQCNHCSGVGYVRMQMHFLSDAFVDCDVCLGKRYNPETLNIRYKKKNISDILDMNVAVAYEFFERHPTLRRKLQTLMDVGLDYITLGQSSTTLSGGEAQRIKLSRELSKRGTAKTLYILDEPTTGLHFHDVNKLVQLLHSLVDQGSTVIVVEHNLDLIKNADYVIDLGPDGGTQGGNIVAHGTPEAIAKSKKSVTGKFLSEALHRQP